MYYAEVTDTTGTKWQSDTADEPLTDFDRAAIEETFGDFPAIKTIAIDIQGVKHHFNPAHVIAIALVEVAS